MTNCKIQRILCLRLPQVSKSVIFDRWKPETVAGNAGESGLVDWLDRLTPAAQIAGQIAQSVERYHQELWHSLTAPQVHILCAQKSDDNLRLGMARSLMNANVPFAFVTASQLLNDTVLLAPILFFPGSEFLSETLLIKLKALVENGTRLVTEVPTGFCNDKGELLNTRPDSPFEQLFGTSIAGMFYADAPNSNNAHTFGATAGANRHHNGATGRRRRRSSLLHRKPRRQGRALLINLHLSRIIADASQPNAQLSLLSYLLGSRQTELSGLTGCLQFRRQSQNAEHIFLINDSAEERTVSIPAAASFTTVTDVLADTPLPITEGTITITIPPGSGSWLRLSAPG